MTTKTKKSVKGNETKKANNVYPIENAKAVQIEDNESLKEERLIEIKKRLIELMTASLDVDLNSEQLKEQFALEAEKKKLQKTFQAKHKEEEKLQAISESFELLKNRINLFNATLHETENPTIEKMSEFLGTLNNIKSEVKKAMPSARGVGGSSNYDPTTAESTPEREEREYKQAIEWLEEGNELKNEKPLKRMYRAYHLFNADAKQYTKLIEAGKEPNEVIKRRYIAVNNLVKVS